MPDAQQRDKPAGSAARGFLWLLTRGLRVAGFTLVLAGLALGAYQVFFYLRQGHWLSVPLLAAVDAVPFESFIPRGGTLREWLRHPRSWYGLHKALTFMLLHTPLWLFISTVGLLIALRMSNESERFRRRHMSRP